MKVILPALSRCFAYVALCTAVLWVSSPALAGPLDFYSQIDDAWDALSLELTSRHLNEYPTFRSFGKQCRAEASWFDTEAMDESHLRDISQGNLTYISEVAGRKNITLTTEELNRLGGCLTETYQKMQTQSKKQAHALETAGSIGIFSDGNADNSDFDIMVDIEKINAIIFSSEEQYHGSVNITAQALAKFLKWDKAPELSWPDTNTNTGTTATGSNTGNTTTPPQTTGGTPLKPIWDTTCNTDGSIGSVDNMVNERFLRDLDSTLRGNTSPSWDDGEDYSAHTHSNSGNTESHKDFFHKPACDGIFCITVGTVGTTQKVLVGGRNNSIETILIQHLEKVDPLSWSDLSGQKMTQNYWQLPFLNIKFRSKVAGAWVFMHNKPQVTKRFESENTEQKQEEQFDNAYRCAMIDAGLPLDELKSAGVTGAGFSIDDHNSESIHNASLPLNAFDKERLRTANNCSELYTDIARTTNEEAWSMQVGEVQAFTSAIMDVIVQILDTEMKLDTVKAQ